MSLSSAAAAMHEHANEGQPELQPQQYKQLEDQMMMDDPDNGFLALGRERWLDDDILDVETDFTRADEFPSLSDFVCHSSSPSLLPLVRSSTITGFSPVGPSSSTASTQSDACWARQVMEQALVSTGPTEICEDGVGQSGLKEDLKAVFAEIDSRLDAANECGLENGLDCEQREEHVGGYMIMNEGEHKGNEEHSIIFYNTYLW